MLFREFPMALVCTAMLIFGMLTTLSFTMKPTLFLWLNTLRTALFAVCTWAALCSVALVAGMSHPVCTVLLIAGCMVVGVVAAVATYFYTPQEHKLSLQDSLAEVTEAGDDDKREGDGEDAAISTDASRAGASRPHHGASATCRSLS